MFDTAIDIDAYPEYTGTALQSFFGKQPDELPKDPQAAFAEVRKAFAGRGVMKVYWALVTGVPSIDDGLNVIWRLLDVN